MSCMPVECDDANQNEAKPHEAVLDGAMLTWEDGDLPVSTQFQDPYFSRQDGLAEARHVFLAGNRLEQRFPDCTEFAIAELGFGTGLNFLAALMLWRRSARPGARLHYTAFERYPMTAADMERALRPWPELDALRDEVLGALTSDGAHLADADLVVIRGDARTRLPDWTGAADAWFLDGFAPARNPEMWDPALLARVHTCTAKGGTCATYSAAGAVRRALQAAGFTIARVPGFGHKREMLVGHRAD